MASRPENLKLQRGEPQHVQLTKCLKAFVALAGQNDLVVGSPAAGIAKRLECTLNRATVLVGQLGALGIIELPGRAGARPRYRLVKPDITEVTEEMLHMLALKTVTAAVATNAGAQAPQQVRATPELVRQLAVQLAVANRRNAELVEENQGLVDRLKTAEEQLALQGGDTALDPETVAKLREAGVELPD